jgi:zinc transport system substrate-binding protein
VKSALAAIGAVGLTLCAAAFLVSCSSAGTSDDDRLRVFVSIEPQRCFAEKVGGERVAVSVLVQPGQNPHTYEPTPRQMAELAGAKVYFRIGMPFEEAWMPRILSVNPHLDVVDTRKGIRLRTMESGYTAEGVGEAEHDEHSPGAKDPHIWLSPPLVKHQARNMCDALCRIDPAHSEERLRNLRAFDAELDALDADIRRTLKDLRTRRFLVFHPTYGYFADEYGLRQIAIEIEGKEPTAKSLARVVGIARENGIKAVFVQEQFSRQTAETVAREIGGRVIETDPLAPDYVKAMHRTAREIGEACR